MSQYNIDFLLHTKKYLNILVVLWFMEANLAQSGFIIYWYLHQFQSTLRIKITMNTTLAAFYNTYRNAKDYHNFVSKLQQKSRIMLNKLFTECLICIPPSQFIQFCRINLSDLIKSDLN